MLEIKSLRHTYDDHEWIEFPDWEVNADQAGMIIGGSGSGKTTLLHIIAGLLRPREGKIRLDDYKISEMNAKAMDHFRGKEIGIVFQRPHLISSLTVQENLLLAQKIGTNKTDKRKVKELLKELEIEMIAGRKIHKISQGQAQRVAIARAVINHPSLLLADEPTASLDDENCKRVIDLLIQQAKRNEATLVVATHDNRIKPSFSKVLEL